MTGVNGVVLDECQRVAAALESLAESSYAVETNCPPWTLKELVVHIWQSIQLPKAFNTGEGTPTTAADWYRRGERETPEYRTKNVDQAKSAASFFSSGADAAEALVAAGERFEERISECDLEALIRTANAPAISLRDFTITRVISVAVHGLDVALSLRTEPFTSPSGQRVTCAVLEELLGASSSELGWTDNEMMLWATGRRPPHEQRTPGWVVDRLPVIS